MKKFKFTISGNDYEVEIQNIEDDIATLEVNGSAYDVKIHRDEVKSKTPTIVRRPVVQTGGATQKTSSPTESKGAGSIKAPLPGTILEMKVKEGDSVTVGQTLLIMEAMKMENEIKADSAGVIKAIKVNLDQAVLEGDVLIEIGS